MRRILPLMILLQTSPASAAVKVGEISAVRADALPALRRAVDDELSHVRVTKEAIVSVSLVRLDHGTCVVSAVLRDKNGTMFAMLEGRASSSAQDMALKGAVHGAISRIPDALR
jgi:hypothetical protein